MALTSNVISSNPGDYLMRRKTAREQKIRNYFGLAKTERRTRLVAQMWGQGFVDLVCTDGSHKISGYLSKYMSKTFVDSRLRGKKAFIASRNIKRPVVQKNAMVEPLFFGDLEDIPDLSTALLLKERHYDTVWLGRGRYRLYKTS